MRLAELPSCAQAVSRRGKRRTSSQSTGVSCARGGGGADALRWAGPVGYGGGRVGGG